MSDVNPVVDWNVAVPSDENVASARIEIAKTLAVVAISERVILPTKTQTQRQFGSHLPVVLQVPRPLRLADGIRVE